MLSALVDVDVDSNIVVVPVLMVNTGVENLARMGLIFSQDIEVVLKAGVEVKIEVEDDVILFFVIVDFKLVVCKIDVVLGMEEVYD